MAITLDPTRLPRLDILSLARNGLILRAERDTPEGGIPTFLTRTGWNELVAHHRREKTSASQGDSRPETPHYESEAETAARLLPALEKTSARLLSEAAREADAQKAEDASLFTVETDLFPSSSQTRIILVADRTHPVACALLGTPAQITQLLASTGAGNGEA